MSYGVSDRLGGPRSVEHLDRAKTARISVLASLGVTAAEILVLLSQFVWE